MKKLIRPGRSLLFLAFILSLAQGCSHLKKGNGGEEAAGNAIKILQGIQQKYAPDPRLSIFKIAPEQQGDYLILRGEVDNPDAKRELVESLQKMGIKAVDRITVLPSDKLGDAVWGIVRVSVSNFRENPSPAAELGTQALMGQVIRVWKQEGGWFYVQSSDRYLGWTEDDVFVRCTKEEVNAWNSSERVIVTDYEDRVWEKPNAESSFPVTDVVMGVLLKKTGEEGDWFKVELPDGRAGYLAKKSAMDFSQWRNTRQATPENIIHTAKSFMGVPYLWGGTSAKGVDCSGFTKLVYQMNGIQLLRNASHQAYQGTLVPLDAELSQLKPGDLLFFGRKAVNRNPERVTHVGIYLGNKMFIHSSGMVKINSLDPKSALLDERRLKGLLGVRRYLPE